MCEVASFKNFENSLTSVKVMTKTKVAPFYLGHGVESWSYYGEEIMTLAFFVLTQYRRVTDGRTDRHVAIPITRASIASRG